MTALLMASCGIFKWPGHDASDSRSRQLASLGAQLLVADEAGLNERLTERLKALHCYYLIGHRLLAELDSHINELSLTELYQSESYRGLMAVRSQVDEIERELQELLLDLSKTKSHAQLAFEMRSQIHQFSKRTVLRAQALENLRARLQINMSANDLMEAKKTDLATELAELSSTREFMVFEQNIQHLSHMLDINVTEKDKKFFPSSGKQGNISGLEFPDKVWSLTFNDGPHEAISPIILKALTQRGMKATFFQITQNAKSLPQIAQAFRDAGMEIGSHSYDHSELTKVGALTLEKEIVQAVSELQDTNKREVKFFRLPYGAGVNSRHVREKIAENNLIHVFWSIDTLDWMPQDPSKIVQRTLAIMQKSKKDAGVILFHDVHLRSAVAAPEIMDHLKKDGRRVCTLDEIVSQMNANAEKVCQVK